MTRYRGNPDAIRALVRGGEVHRDVYTDPELFDLEMERLWRSAWVYVGHESQVPKPGDYLTAEIAGQPLLMVRSTDRQVRVFYNRCAHRGARIVSAASGNCGGTLALPLSWVDLPPRRNAAHGAAEGRLCRQRFRGIARGARTFRRARRRRASRIRIRTARRPRGRALRTISASLYPPSTTWRTARPTGRLEVVGGTLRYLHECNWKLFIENLNDTMHPMVAHESSAGTARDLWKDQPPDAPKPMVIEQFLPFVSNYEFFDKMGVKLYENGHSYTGVNFSIHSKYSAMPEYEARMEAAYGAERARAILGEIRHNTVYYPSLTVKGAIQTIRVVRPIAVDRTLIESLTLRLVGAPDALLERSVMYNRLINAPTSVVGHDDMHCYRSIQEGLGADGNEWVSLSRNHSRDEDARGIAGVYNGTSEVSVRGQFRAWLAAMAPDERGRPMRRRSRRR